MLEVESKEYSEFRTEQTNMTMILKKKPIDQLMPQDLWTNAVLDFSHEEQ